MVACDSGMTELRCCSQCVVFRRHAAGVHVQDDDDDPGGGPPRAAPPLRRGAAAEDGQGRREALEELALVTQVRLYLVVFHPYITLHEAVTGTVQFVGGDFNFSFNYRNVDCIINKTVSIE